MKQNNQINDVYENPLEKRYASKEMLFIFSSHFRFTTWRKLWVYLAEAQKEQGLSITKEQIDQMKENLEKFDYELIAQYEKNFKHDVMAHIHAFCDLCPKSAPIIHLGATSAYVVDNTDLIQIKKAFFLLKSKILDIIFNLKKFALKYKDLPTLGYTHFQAAQLTTVGKRACLWLQELLLDLQAVIDFIEDLPFRGIKGTTGTLASFAKLFNGDLKKIKKIDESIRNKCGFEKNLLITGQTYTRKLDDKALSILSSLGQSASKFAFDMRLLQNKKELEEPFEENQIGSSAMPYKRNPMKSERIGSLSRFVMALNHTTAYTASTQWFERTLDDSANKRLSIPQAFLAVDAILDIYRNISSGIVVYPKMIDRHLQEELPFMMSENILMESVKNGGDRQKLHEVIRVLSMEAGKRIKEEGKNNNLLQLIAAEPAFNLSEEALNKLKNAKNYIGLSDVITVDFIKTSVNPFLKNFKPLKPPSLKV